MSRDGALTKRLRVLVPTLLAAALVTSVVTAPVDDAVATPKEPSAAELQKKIDALTAKMGQTNERYNTANSTLTTTKSQRATIGKQIAAKQTEVTKLKGLASKYAAGVYKGADLSMYSSVLTSKTPQSFIQQMTTVNALTGANQRNLTALTNGQQFLASQRKKLDTLITNTTNLQKQLAAQKAAYQKDVDKFKKLKQKVDPTVSNGSTGGKAPADAGPVVAFAYSQLGEDYVFGASGPDTWDCSGLTMMAYKTVGVSLPHSARGQQGQSKSVSRGEVAAGDLVFGNYSGHVGIAISNSKMIHAPTEGDVVKISSIDSVGFSGAGRP